MLNTSHRHGLAIVALLFILLSLPWWLLLVPAYGEICHKSEYTGQKECATYDIALVVLWHIGEFLNYYSGAILAIVTSALAVYTYRLWRDAKQTSERQADDMRESLDIAAISAEAAKKNAQIAEDTLLVGERPYIFVTDIRFEQPISQETFNYGGPEVWPWAIYHLENHGRTPAVVTEMCYESMCVAALPDVPEYRRNRTHDQLRRVYGHDTRTTLNFVFKTPIDGQLMNDIGIGTRELFAYGYVKYDDIFGYVNTVGYCWRYNLSLARFLPDDHPAYNYRKVEKKQQA